MYIALDVVSVYETILYCFLSPKYPYSNAGLRKSMQMRYTDAHSHLTMMYPMGYWQ